MIEQTRTLRPAVVEKTIKTSPRPNHVSMASAVAEDIRRLMKQDRRMTRIERPGLEFLLSLGLTVKDPSDRMSLLCKASEFALMETNYDDDTLPR